MAGFLAPPAYNIYNQDNQVRFGLQEIMDVRVHLKLFVKLREKWMDDPAYYNIWGLDNRF